MKTKTTVISIRVKPILKNKLERYFLKSKIKNILEAVLDVTEKNPYIKNKIIEALKNREV